MRNLFILLGLLWSSQVHAQIDSVQTMAPRIWSNDSLLITQHNAPNINPGKVALISALFQEAFTHLSTPYLSGGKEPGGFDCSGFVKHCYGQVLSMDVPSSSADYASYGDSVDLSTCTLGDIICFKGSDKNLTKIGHIGIITEVSSNDIFFIHSASHGGIRVDKLSTKYYRERLVGIRRIIP